MLTKIISVSLLLFLTFLSGCAPAQLNKTEGVSSEYESKNSEKSEELQSSEATEIKQVSIYQGDFELPLDGATGYASVALDVKNDLSTSSTVLSQLNPGAVFTILKEQDDWLQIQTETIIGWVQKPYILINLPDVIPSIIYKNTNVDNSVFRSSGESIPNITDSSLYDSKGYNTRLNREEYIMPVLFPMAKKIMAAQKMALNENNTLIIYEGFRPFSVQMKIAEELQKLALSNPEVMQGISQAPWSIDWFISTKVSNHQVGYAIDVSLGKVIQLGEEIIGNYLIKPVVNYEEYLMQTNIHELSTQSAIYSAPVTVHSSTAWEQAIALPAVNQYTFLLQKYMTNNGLTPLASEWWHFNDLDSLNLLNGTLGTGEFILNKTASKLPN